MERVSKAYRPVHRGYPEFHAKLAHANDLTSLEHEAQEQRRSTVADACARMRACVLIGAPLHRDDINIVQTFIGQRTGQDRYGR